MKRRPGLVDNLSDPQGAVIVVVALVLAVLLGFAALAVDAGYLMVVRNELQNAADAAALALASKAFDRQLGGDPDPKSAAAQALARNLKGWAIGLNKAAKTTLVDCQVPLPGYWNLTGSPDGLEAAGITPTVNDAPAIMVAVSKSTGNNGGPVNLFFAQVLGIKSRPVSAQAVAALPSPGSVEPGSLFPIAIAKALYANPLYWDSDRRRPQNDPGTGHPYKFQIKSSYDSEPVKPGQWTSFERDTNDAMTLVGLIQNKNPNPISVGQEIWIQPGVESSVYNPSLLVGLTVLIGIVDQIDSHAKMPLIAFGAIHLDSVVNQDNQTYLEFELWPYYKVLTGRPYGPCYGAYTAPKLVR